VVEKPTLSTCFGFPSVTCGDVLVGACTCSCTCTSGSGTCTWWQSTGYNNDVWWCVARSSVFTVSSTWQAISSCLSTVHTGWSTRLSGICHTRSVGSQQSFYLAMFSRTCPEFATGSEFKTCDWWKTLLEGSRDMLPLWRF